MRWRQLSIAAILTLLIIPACFGAAIDLGTIFVPRTGDIDLKAGNTYVQKSGGKWARSCRWRKVGNGADPIIVFQNQGRDFNCFYTNPGDTPTFEHLTVVGNKWTYAFGGEGGITASSCTVMGGAGLSKIEGATGPVSFTDCVISDPAWNYEFYSGPKIIRTPTYTERWSGSLKMLRVTAKRGSLEMSGLRIQAFNDVDVRDCEFWDLPSQSAVRPDGSRAVTGAVIRVHFVNTAVFVNVVTHGDWFVGPLDGDDGGINYPPGPERDATQKHEVTNMRVSACKILEALVQASPGCRACLVETTEIQSTVGAAWTCRPAYWGRIAPGVNWMNAKATVKTPPRGIVGNNGRCSATNSTLNGASYQLIQP